jgi:hypothetical protein
MTSSQRKTWLPLAVLAAALVVWAAVLALGTYLQWGADQSHHDPRKAWIVLGTMAGFLAFWGLALWIRAWRRGK